MHEELIEKLRCCVEQIRCADCRYSMDCDGDRMLMSQAADAIGGLEKACEEAYNKGLLEGGIAQRAEDEKWLPKWIPVTEENNGEV